MLHDPNLKERLTPAGKKSAAAATELASLLHSRGNEESSIVFGKIRGGISEMYQADDLKEGLITKWAPLDVGGKAPVPDAFLKITPNDCECLRVSENSAHQCPATTQTGDAIGRLADALVGMGYPPGHGNQGEENTVKIHFLTLFRGKHEKQADGTEKVVGGNCSIELRSLNEFLNAFGKASSKNKPLFEKVFKILVEGFSPCSFTRHVAEEGVLRILAEKVCGKWPFDSVEPISFSCFEKVRQELCQAAHIRHWPKEWGEWRNQGRKK